MGGRWHDYNSSPFVSSFMLFRLVPLNTFSNLPTFFGSVSGSQTSASPSPPPFSLSSPVNAIPFCFANQDRARELRRTLDISRYKKPFQRERLTTPRPFWPAAFRNLKVSLPKFRERRVIYIQSCLLHGFGSTRIIFVVPARIQHGETETSGHGRPEGHCTVN